MSTSIYLRTYTKDKDWLPFCLRALRKFAKGYEEIVICVLEEEKEQFKDIDLTGCKFVTDPRWCANDYIGQQASKLNCDRHCSGNFVLHMDSDCIITREFDVNEYFKDGQPMVLFRKWEDVGGAAVWKSPTECALGRASQFETMATHPSIWWKSTHELVRRRIASQNNCSFDEYMAKVTQISEFNILGNYAHLFQPEAYRFVRCVGPERDIYPRVMKQYFSHDRVTPALAEEFEAILK